MKISFLYGVTIPGLARLFARHKGKISFRYVPSFLLHVLYAIPNSVFSLFDRFWKDKGLPADITFLMGHYRSGTTHLNNVLVEEGGYVSPTTYQCLFPSSFLSTERFMAPILDLISPKFRPMDNMSMTMKSPQEDEIAMAACGVASPYLSVHFPVTGQFYRQCLSFKGADLKDVNQWKSTHLKFAKKLVIKYGNKPILLKAPANTARIPLLLEMYPNAKFIYIHRDPYRTIQSSLHLYDVWFRMDNFQSLKALKARKLDDVLDVYEEIMMAWKKDEKLIPENRKVSISFGDLVAKPFETIEQITQTLQKRKPDKNKLEQCFKPLSSYKLNEYETLPDVLREKVNQRFDWIFREYGYEKAE